jgi:two-component sensor histidine kinase
MVLPESSRAYADDLHRRFILGETNESAGEWQVKCKDGSLRDIYVTAGRMVAADNAVFKVTTVTDITERKAQTRALEEALAAREAMVREAHHRVRNNLTIVSGLLQIQADKVEHMAEIHPLFTDSINRIRALANIHERLYKKSGIAYIQADDYLQDLVAGVVETFGSQAEGIDLQISMAPLELNIDQTICCGLIVNEAVSNAIKHGIKGDRGGPLEVVLEKEEDAETYSLMIRDHGPGFPSHVDLGHCNTLGLQLITNLAHQLDGLLVLKRENGAVVQVIFKPIHP